MVNLPREAHYGMEGRDITAHQRALTAAGVRHHSVTGHFGPVMLDNVRAFQGTHRLHADGVIGAKTFEALRSFYDGYSLWLLSHMRPPSKRDEIRHAALYGVFRKDSIHYTQGADRMDWLKLDEHIPLYPHHTDCSGFATWCYWQAKAPDPNGFGYNGYGFTGTQIAHGRRVTKPTVGDLVFYGWPIDHVAVYVGDNNVVSHGSEEGPLLLTMFYRTPTEYRSYL